MRFILQLLNKNIKSGLKNVRLLSTITPKDDDFMKDIEKDLESDKEYEELARRFFGVSSFHNCLIIHPYVKWGPDKVRDTNPEKQLNEAIGLIRTLAPWKVKDTIATPLTSLCKKTLFGKGKMEELKAHIRKDPTITTVFINVGNLRNKQLQALEGEFGVQILDRYRVVMQILKLHATSTHAKLQVALAELPYLRSRLRKDDFSIVASDDYDTRRLMLQNREQKIKAAIKKLKLQRQLLRNGRKQKDYPVIAVVGYTNAGKTSLIKALTGDKNLQPKNHLFATLDVTVHAGKLPSNLEVLYVDTIGFISDIPTNLIECFVVTLEDAMLADLIIHVEDLSSDDLIHQRNHVLETLKNLADKTDSHNLLDKMITVGNKFDLAPQAVVAETSLAISSTTLLGIDCLRHTIEEEVMKVTDRKVLTIRVSSGHDEMQWLYKNSAVISVAEDEENSQYQKMKVIIASSKLKQFMHYFVNR